MRTRDDHWIIGPTSLSTRRRGARAGCAAMTMPISPSMLVPTQSITASGVCARTRADQLRQIGGVGRHLIASRIGQPVAVPRGPATSTASTRARDVSAPPAHRSRAPGGREAVHADHHPAGGRRPAFAGQSQNASRRGAPSRDTGPWTGRNCSCGVCMRRSALKVSVITGSWRLSTNRNGTGGYRCSRTKPPS